MKESNNILLLKSENMAKCVDNPDFGMTGILIIGLVLYLVKLLICEDLYFATNFIKLSVVEQMLWNFVGLGSHIGYKIA